MSKIIPCALAALALAGLSQQALAREDQPRSLAISTASVNFDSESQVADLYDKVAQAAAAVCNSNSRDPAVRFDDRICIRRAIALAVSNVNKPTLTAMYKVNRGSAADVRLASR
jgi:UrcA family protein